jgi:hypothetical protein
MSWKKKLQWAKPGCGKIEKYDAVSVVGSLLIQTSNVPHVFSTAYKPVQVSQR